MSGGVGLFDGDLSRANAVHLSCTDAYSLTVFSHHDGVGLNVLYDLLGKEQIGKLLLCRFYLGYGHLC